MANLLKQLKNQISLVCWLLKNCYPYFVFLQSFWPNSFIYYCYEFSFNYSYSYSYSNVYNFCYLTFFLLFLQLRLIPKKKMKKSIALNYFCKCKKIKMKKKTIFQIAVIVHSVYDFGALKGCSGICHLDCIF